GEIFVEDLGEETVDTAEKILEVMERGETNRHTGETNMNERSSRSHTIFRMIIESEPTHCDGNDNSTHKHVEGDDEHPAHIKAKMVSVLTLVDLAGSERISQTKAEGTRLKEGAHINKSLLALGSVISKLSSDPDG
ncbi:hypothetical protein SARC_04325, partial [Sphaeroforma arctica JP610]